MNILTKLLFPETKTPEQVGSPRVQKSRRGIETKSAAEIVIMRQAGKIAATVLKEIAEIAQPGMTTADLERDLYVTKPAPNTLDEALDQVEQRYGISIPMSNLAANDPCAELMADVKQIIFIGNDMVNREQMYHLLLIGSDRDYQIWVTQDATPLLRKAIITYKTLPGSPQYTAILSDWNFNPSTPADTFTFQPGSESIPIELLPPRNNQSQP